MISAGLGFLLLAALARSMDLEIFGKYVLITTLLVFFSVILDFGTNSLYVSQSIINLKINIFQKFLSAKVILFSISVILCIPILILFNLGNILNILIFIAGLFAYTNYHIVYAINQKREKYLLVSLVMLIPAIIKGLYALGIFLNFFSPNLISAFGTFSFSVFGASILYLFIPKKHFTLRLDTKYIKRFLQNASPAGISQVIRESWFTISNSTAKFINGFSDVGIYSLAGKISHIFVFISFSIFTVLLPKNTKRKSKKLNYDFKETGILSAAVILIAIIGVFVVEFFLVKIFGEKFSESIKLVQILLFAGAFAAIHTFMENYFFIENKINYIFYINSGKLVLFLILIFTLLPTRGLLGIALADLLSSIAAGLGTFYFIKKLQRVG